LERAMPLFPLGRLLITPAARDLLELQDLDPLLFAIRHGKGEWGDLDDEDKAENDLSVKEGFRILSAYVTPMGRIWVITEADRSHTTILLPSEY
jgi:hypothetical protein